MGYDKKIAGTNSVRIPEKVFFLIAALGGSLGILLAMRHFRHKTRKASFQYVLGVISIIQILFICKYYIDFKNLMTSL